MKYLVDVELVARLVEHAATVQTDRDMLVIASVNAGRIGYAEAVTARAHAFSAMIAELVLSESAPDAVPMLALGAEIAAELDAEATELSVPVVTALKAVA